MESPSSSRVISGNGAEQRPSEGSKHQAERSATNPTIENRKAPCAEPWTERKTVEDRENETIGGAQEERENYRKEETMPNGDFSVCEGEDKDPRAKPSIPKPKGAKVPAAKPTLRPYPGFGFGVGDEQSDQGCNQAEDGSFTDAHAHFLHVS